jgi:hypothetical protein
VPLVVPHNLIRANWLMVLMGWRRFDLSTKRLDFV